MLNGPNLAGGRTATTDNQGRFTFDALPAGRYFVSVSKAGYVMTSYGQRRVRGPGVGIPLADRESRSIAMQLSRGGVITGTVFDERGDPAINTNIRAMRFSMVNGQRRLQQNGGAVSDDRGIYRLHSLEPGDYIVCAASRGMGMGGMTDAQRVQMEMDSVRRMIESASGPNAAEMLKQMAARLASLQAQLPAQGEPVMGYAPSCFPGTTATAAIPVGAGEERTGIDFQLQLTPVARVEGTIIGAPAPVAGGPPRIQVQLVNVDEAMGPADMMGSSPDPSGRFRFTSVAPGTYRLIARTTNFFQGPGPASAQNTEPRLWAVEEIAVNGQDILNVALELRRGMSISGQVTFEGQTGTNPPPDFSRLQVGAVPVMSFPPTAQLGTSVQTTVDSSGRFTLSDVLPGRYRIMTMGGGAGWVSASSVVGNQDTLDHPFELKPDQSVSGVTLTLTDRISELSGVIASERGEAATDYTILLYPTDEKYWTSESRRIRALRADTDGKFVFRAIPPGEYRIATLVDVEYGAWLEPGFLDQLSTSSVRISVAEGEKKIHNLNVSSAVR
jgi:hypothetical protein